MHHFVQLMESGVLAHQGTHLLHYVGTMRSKGMATEDESVGGGDAELDISLCLVHRKSTTVGAIHLLAHFYLNALCLQLIFGFAHTGCLGIGEDCGWHNVETDVIGNAKYMIHYMKALHCGCMG